MVESRTTGYSLNHTINNRVELLARTRNGRFGVELTVKKKKSFTTQQQINVKNRNVGTKNRTLTASCEMLLSAGAAEVP